MKTKIVSAFYFAAAAAILVLAGAGCLQSVNRVGNELGNEVVQPVAVPISALNKAKQVTSEANAKANEQTESVANEMTVAMVLTEGAKAPEGAQLGDTFGCQDRVAFVKVPRETDSGDTLKDVLTSLLAVKDTNYKGYYTALAFSTLKVDKIQSTDGVTTEVWLSGLPKSGGACDDPRIKEQLEQTIKRLRPNFKIFLNGSEAKYNCIGDLSGRCSVQ